MKKLFFYSFWLVLLACSPHRFAPIRYQTTVITPQFDSTIQASTPTTQWLQPYQSKLSAALDSVLFYSCRNVSKKQPESALGSHLTQIMRFSADQELMVKTDGAMLNYGGIRASLPKGTVRIRNVFEIMPFDNTLCVIQMDSQQMLLFAQYWVASKGHPIDGFKIKMNENNQPFVSWNSPKVTYPVHMVVTDYIANGGDNATFFKQIVNKKYLKSPLREVLIQYYRSHYRPTDTLCLPLD